MDHQHPTTFSKSSSRNVWSRWSQRCALLSLSGCSLVLDLDERTCTIDQDCAIDGSMRCNEGVCEAVTGWESTTTSMPTTMGEEAASLTVSGLTTDSTEATSQGDSTSSDTSTSETCSSSDCAGTETEAGTSTMSDSTGSDDSSDPVPPLIVNGDFENGDFGWVRRGPGSTTAIHPETEIVHSGEGSILVTGRQNTWHGLAQGVTASLETDVVYSLEAYVRLAEEHPTSVVLLTLALFCVGDSDMRFLSIGNAAARNDAWTLIEGSFRVEASCQVSEATIYFEGAFFTVPDDSGGATVSVTDGAGTDGTGTGGTGTGGTGTGGTDTDGTGSSESTADDGGDEGAGEGSVVDGVRYLNFYVDDVVATGSRR